MAQLDRTLKDNDGLTSLILYNMNIKDEDCVFFKSHFERNPYITTLDLNSISNFSYHLGNKITSQGLALLTEALKGHLSIARLDLSWNPLS